MLPSRGQTRTHTLHAYALAYTLERTQLHVPIIVSASLPPMATPSADELLKPAALHGHGGMSDMSGQPATGLRKLAPLPSLGGGHSGSRSGSPATDSRASPASVAADIIGSNSPLSAASGLTPPTTAAALAPVVVRKRSRAKLAATRLNITTQVTQGHSCHAIPLPLSCSRSRALLVLTTCVYVFVSPVAPFALQRCRTSLSSAP